MRAPKGVIKIERKTRAPPPIGHGGVGGRGLCTTPHHTARHRTAPQHITPALHDTARHRTTPPRTLRGVTPHIGCYHDRP